MEWLVEGTREPEVTGSNPGSHVARDMWLTVEGLPSLKEIVFFARISEFIENDGVSRRWPAAPTNPRFIATLW